MRNILRISVVGAAIAVLVGIAAAQGSDWYHQREERYRGEHWRARMFTEIREDLNHVQTTAFSGREEYRIARTKQKLDTLQSDLRAGRYSETALDEVIGSMRRLVADNRLTPRDRDILNDDLHRLQQYRDHHDRWGR